MNRENSLVLAIDPGSEHVGWSKSKGSAISIDYGIDTPHDFYAGFKMFPTIYIDRVVIERFDLRQFTDESQLTVEVVGVIKWLCYEHNIPVGFVNASSKRKYAEFVRQNGIRSHAADAEAIRLWDLDYGRW